MWIFTPIYKDVDSFLILRERILALGLGDKPHFVVIDDSAGSDAAISKLRNFDDVEIFTCPAHLGHQSALVLGLRGKNENVADDDIVVTMDGDGQDIPADLPRLLARLEPDNIVIARPTNRKASVVLRILFRLLTGLSAIESGNFAAMRGRTLKKVINDKKFTICFCATLTYVGVPYIYLDCQRGDRFVGISHMDKSQRMKHGWRMMLTFHDRMEFRLSILVAIVVAFLVFRR